MLINQQPTHVRTGGTVQESAKFSFEATAQAFQAVIGGIYSDKIGAIVRELISNQWDAHVEAGGKDVPFEVIAPTMFSPTVEFIDYGWGLSPEFMLNGYVKIFNSTKNESNDAIGGFGLGRTAPFCYTDTFTVESRYRGFIYTYQVYVDSMGLPTIQQVDYRTWDGPSGLTVKVPVESKDLQEWDEKIKEYCKYITPQPICNIDLPIPEPLYADDDWEVYANTDRSWGKGNTFKVRQGITCYAVDSYKVDAKLNSNSYTVVVNVPIGTVSVTTSREDLEYTDRTIAALNQVWEETQAKYTKYLEEQLLEIEKPYDKMVLYETMSSLLGSRRFNFTHKGLDYTTTSTLEVLNGHIHPKIFPKYIDDVHANNQRYDQYTIPYKPLFRLDKVPPHSLIGARAQSIRKENRFRINWSSVVFLACDDHRWRARLFENSKWNDDKGIILISPAPNVDLADAVKAFKDEWGADVEYVSKLPNQLPDKVKGVRTNYGTTPLYLVSSNYWTTVDNNVVVDLVTNTSKKYYVKSNRFEVQINGATFGKDTLLALLDQLKRVKAIDDTMSVYAVPKSNIKLIDDFDSNWIPLADLIKEKSKEIQHKVFLNTKYLGYRGLTNNQGWCTRYMYDSTLGHFIRQSDLDWREVLSVKTQKMLKKGERFATLLRSKETNDTTLLSDNSLILDTLRISNTTRAIDRVSRWGAQLTKMLQDDIEKALENCPTLRVGIEWRCGRFSSYYNYTKSAEHPLVNLIISEYRKEHTK